MPNITDLTTEIRPILPVFWVIDTSASMAGERINQMQNIYVNFINEAKNVTGDDIELRTGILSFNTDAHWVFESGLVSTDEANLEDLNLTVEGMTNVGKALQELNNKLSKVNGGFFKGYNILKPIIVFVLDGYSTDEYETQLETLYKNRWFNHSVKLGFAMGPDADIGLLESIVGKEATFTDISIFNDTLHYFIKHYSPYSVGRIIPDDMDAIMEDDLILPTEWGDSEWDDSILPTEDEDIDLVIDLNQMKYPLNCKKYKIVRCQLRACDPRTFNQECLEITVSSDHGFYLMKHIDPVPDSFYFVRLIIEKDQSIKVGADLFEQLFISGLVEIKSNYGEKYTITGLSESSEITVVLDYGQEIALEIGQNYEIETSTSKVNIRVYEDWHEGEW